MNYHETAQYSYEPPPAAAAATTTLTNESTTHASVHQDTPPPPIYLSNLLSAEFFAHDSYGTLIDFYEINFEKDVMNSAPERVASDADVDPSEEASHLLRMTTLTLYDEGPVVNRGGVGLHLEKSVGKRK